MIQKTQINISLAGIVLFDPIVINDFVLENKIHEENLLKYFIKFPLIGDKAIKEGIIVPIYSITEWDYNIILNDCVESSVDEEWKLYVTEGFPLSVKGNKIIVSDIFSIMNWDPDYYLNFPSREERSGVDDDFKIEPGLYSIKILGFRDKTNPDVENRECGFEFLIKETQVLPDISKFDISKFNFKVDGFFYDSN